MVLDVTTEKHKITNVNSRERNEVLLDKGDGLLDAGLLTQCKNAVCYIFCNKEDSEKRGTGFYASIEIEQGKEDRVVITNNHVLSDRIEANAAVARFHYEGKLPGADVRLRPDLLFFTDKYLDYTIVGCEHDTIENEFCIDPLHFVEEEEEINCGDDIFIFQHPKGDTKKFSYQKISQVQNPFVYYDADTDIGSSGSPVLRKFKLIAIHSKGSDLHAYNKGTLCTEIIHHLRTGTYKSEIKAITQESAPVHAKRKSDCLDMNPDQSHTKRPCEFTNLNMEKPSDEKLEELSKDIVMFWKPFGRALKIPNNEIDRIQKDHYNYDDICEKIFAMLQVWKEKSATPTMQCLKDALVKLGKNDTARKHFGDGLSD